MMLVLCGLEEFLVLEIWVVDRGKGCIQNIVCKSRHKGYKLWNSKC